MNNYKELYENLSKEIYLKFKTKVILRHDSEDQYLKSIDMIIINKNNPWKHRFYALMHELGHVIIDLNEAERNENFPLDKGKKFTRKDAISIITEEYDAWRIGKEFVKANLDLKIDYLYLNKLKTNCLMSYVVESLQKVYGKNINIDCIKTSL